MDTRGQTTCLNSGIFSPGGWGVYVPQPCHFLWHGKGVTSLPKSFFYFRVTVWRLVGRILVGCAEMLKELLVDGPAKALCSLCRLRLGSRDGSEGINNYKTMCKAKDLLIFTAPPPPHPAVGPWLIFFVERDPVLSSAVKFGVGRRGRGTGKSPSELRRSCQWLNAAERAVLQTSLGF